MAAEKTLREFSVPAVTNVATGPAVDTAGKNFELRTGLITMVQASPFCGLPSEDANAHLQHFLELCDTIVIKDITPDVIRLRLFPFSLVGKAKRWFYQDKEAVTTWAKCSAAFLAKFFPISKTNALRGRIASFQQNASETIPEAWERLQEYILSCPHHGMENWMVLQNFYNGLTPMSKGHLDAAAGGAFLSLTTAGAKALIEKMVEHQSWGEDRTQPPAAKTQKGMHTVKETDMLAAKIDLLMKQLTERNQENPSNSVKAIDSHMTCEVCGEVGHSGNDCPETREDAAYINNGFRQQGGANQGNGWNNQSRSSFQGNSSFNSNQPSLKDLVLGQAKINESLTKKMLSNDKILENINRKLENLTSSLHNQLSFNKMFETQIAQRAAALPTEYKNNFENVKAVSTRGGKTTRDSPNPNADAGKDKEQ